GRARESATGPRAEGAPRRLSRTTRRWIILGGLIVLMMMFLGPTVGSWYSQARTIDRLQAEVTAQESQVAQLRHERELWRSDAYVERQARQRLGFVKVGDQAYTLLDADPKLDDGARSSTWVDSRSPWYTQLWDSTTAADNPNVAP
ncbi:FtsB family cell division protein, partial [Kribbia dieselivorans]|uniref:FtsB family cell division protein n=1 Tax=Kribbia dieselivorans TaxID=331526 RepID=UPI00147040D1